MLLLPHVKSGHHPSRNPASSSGGFSRRRVVATLVGKRIVSVLEGVMYSSGGDGGGAAAPRASAQGNGNGW